LYKKKILKTCFSDKVSAEARSLRTFLMSKEIIYINTEYIQGFF
jgi:hypothetical protein